MAVSHTPDVCAWLGWPASERRRLDAFARDAVPLSAPSRDALSQLRIPDDAIDDVLDGATSIDGSPEARWILERLHAALLAYHDDLAPPWPAPEPGDDPLTRYFHLYVFLTGIPHLMEVHGRRGIHPDVTWHTLSDIGLQVVEHLRREGRFGFDAAFWIWPHFSGRVFRLGRLGFDAAFAKFDGPGFRAGDPVAEVHIPSDGRLVAERADAAFEQAATFFPAHFSDEPRRFAVCESWLLDPQLAEVLPPDSNIVAFQRRFTLHPEPRQADDEVQRYVFGREPASLEDAPRDTTVQRAIVDHLRTGGHWHVRRGWLEL